MIDGMYCRTCRYDLRSAARCCCPECGTAFDPADARTFAHSPFPPWWVRMLVGKCSSEVVAALEFTLTLLLPGPLWIFPEMTRLSRVEAFVLTALWCAAVAWTFAIYVHCHRHRQWYSWRVGSRKRAGAREANMNEKWRSVGRFDTPPDNDAWGCGFEIEFRNPVLGSWLFVRRFWRFVRDLSGAGEFANELRVLLQDEVDRCRIVVGRRQATKERQASANGALSAVREGVLVTPTDCVALREPGAKASNGNRGDQRIAGERTVGHLRRHEAAYEADAERAWFVGEFIEA